MRDVLIVEDDTLAAHEAQDFLARFGHRARVALTSSEAVCEIVWCRPLVVLADRQLPPYEDRALQLACDLLGVPLLDLASTICVVGQKEPSAERMAPKPARTNR